MPGKTEPSRKGGGNFAVTISPLRGQPSGAGRTDAGGQRGAEGGGDAGESAEIGVRGKSGQLAAIPWLAEWMNTVGLRGCCFVTIGLLAAKPCRSMNQPDPVLKRQLPLIAKIVADETWLEGERRGRPVEPTDCAVRAKVCEVVLRMGQEMREQVLRDMAAEAQSRVGQVEARAPDQKQSVAA